MKKLALVLFILSYTKVMAGVPEDCLNIIKTFYGKISNAELNDKKGNSLEYSITTNYTINGVQRSSVSRVKILANASQSQIITDHVEMYYDKENCYTVVPRDRKVILNSMQGQDNLDQYKQLKKFQEEFIEGAEVLRYSKVEGSSNVYEVHFKVDDRNKGLGVEAIRFIVDLKNKSLVKCTIDYKDAMQDQLVIEYGSVQIGVDIPDLNLGLSNRFFDSKGNLKGKYKTFELEDRRSN